MQKILLDTNIYLDFYLDRKDNLKPLGEFAFNLIRETVSCKYFVLITDAHLKEMNVVLRISNGEIWDRILGLLKGSNKIEIVIPTDKQIIEAKEISKLKNIPFYDVLFAVVARDNNCILITRDRHYEELEFITKSICPEEL